LNSLSVLSLGVIAPCSNTNSHTTAIGVTLVPNLRKLSNGHAAYDLSCRDSRAGARPNYATMLTVQQDGATSALPEFASPIHAFSGVDKGSYT